MATVKIVGFKVGVDKSTCYYKVDTPVLEPHSFDWQMSGVKEEDVERALGHYLLLALRKSDFVSVRK